MSGQLFNDAVVLRTFYRGGVLYVLDDGLILAAEIFVEQLKNRSLSNVVAPL